MELRQVERIEKITGKDFKEKFYYPMKPVVITGISREWPAFQKWTWDYFKEIVGHKEVGIYNNIKSDA